MRCLKVPMRCVRVGTFFIGVLGDFLFGWGVEFFT